MKKLIAILMQILVTACSKDDVHVVAICLSYPKAVFSTIFLTIKKNCTINLHADNWQRILAYHQIK